LHKYCTSSLHFPYTTAHSTSFTIQRLFPKRTFTTTRTPKMPLVVPGMMSKEGGSGDDWMSKLMGKKIGDSHNETVSHLGTLSAVFDVEEPGAD
jgi:hypothetical protein